MELCEIVLTEMRETMRINYEILRGERSNYKATESRTTPIDFRLKSGHDCNITERTGGGERGSSNEFELGSELGSGSGLLDDIHLKLKGCRQDRHKRHRKIVFQTEIIHEELSKLKKKDSVENGSIILFRKKCNLYYKKKCIVNSMMIKVLMS